MTTKSGESGQGNSQDLSSASGDLRRFIGWQASEGVSWVVLTSVFSPKFLLNKVKLFMKIPLRKKPIQL